METEFERLIEVLGCDDAHKSLDILSELLGAETFVQGLNPRQQHLHCFGSSGVCFVCDENRFSTFLVTLKLPEKKDNAIVIRNAFASALPNALLALDSREIVNRKFGKTPSDIANPIREKYGIPTTCRAAGCSACSKPRTS